MPKAYVGLRTKATQIIVHDNCRKRFTDSRQFKNSKSDDPEVECSASMSLRSSFFPFEWKEICLFCEEQ